MKENHYRLKNSNNEYFVDWVGDTPCFNSNIIFGAKLSKSDANNLLIVLSDIGIIKCTVVLEYWKETAGNL